MVMRLIKCSLLEGCEGESFLSSNFSRMKRSIGFSGQEVFLTTGKFGFFGDWKAQCDLSAIEISGSEGTEVCPKTKFTGRKRRNKDNILNFSRNIEAFLPKEEKNLPLTLIIE
jgi:hypothetical protein